MKLELEFETYTHTIYYPTRWFPTVLLLAIIRPKKSADRNGPIPKD